MQSRLLRAFQYLQGHGVIRTQKEVAAQMEATEASVSRAFNGNMEYLNPTFMRRFNDAFGHPFNIDWLVYGKGEMLTADAKKTGLNDISDIGKGVTGGTIHVTNASEVDNGHDEKTISHLLEMMGSQLRRMSEQLIAKDRQLQEKDAQLIAKDKQIGQLLDMLNQLKQGL